MGEEVATEGCLFSLPRTDDEKTGRPEGRPVFNSVPVWPAGDLFPPGPVD